MINVFDGKKFFKIIRLNMKNLFFFTFLSIFLLTTSSQAERIALTDIRIGEKITKYFTTSQIDKYYLKETERSKSGELVFGKNKKYSIIGFTKPSVFFTDKYMVVQIIYENGTDKVVSLAGVDAVKSEPECLSKRDREVSNFRKKNIIDRSYREEKDFQTFADGMTDDYVSYDGPKKFFKFSCYVYTDGFKTYRFDIYENEYNNYIYKKFN